jgi:hypothetical protein
MDGVSVRRGYTSAEGLTSDKTHIEYNESALALIADMPGDIASVAMGQKLTLRT